MGTTFDANHSEPESMHLDALSDTESIFNRTLSQHSTPSLSSLESISDWGSVREMHETHALECIKAACDVGKGVNDIARRAEVCDAYMEQALIGALRSGNADTISYLRQQMYYIDSPKRCADIVIAASRHLPGIDTQGKAPVVREFIRLLSHGTTARRLKSNLQAVVEKYPLDRLARQLQLALEKNDAAEIADLRMLMSELSLSFNSKHLKAFAEQLPKAVKQGHGAAIEMIQPLLQHARNEDWYASAIIDAANHCRLARPASHAGTIKVFTLLSDGLEQAPLEQVLTSLASSLPYEKSVACMPALHAFCDALDRHAGRLDHDARERLLAAFDLRTKPRKTGSPFQLTAKRKADVSATDRAAKLEFTEARRAVRARLKDQPTTLRQAFRSVFTRNTAGARTAPG